MTEEERQDGRRDTYRTDRDGRRIMEGDLVRLCLAANMVSGMLDVDDMGLYRIKWRLYGFVLEEVEKNWFRDADGEMLGQFGDVFILAEEAHPRPIRVTLHSPYTEEATSHKMVLNCSVGGLSVEGAREATRTAGELVQELEYKVNQKTRWRMWIEHVT